MSAVAEEDVAPATRDQGPDGPVINSYAGRDRARNIGRTALLVVVIGWCMAPFVWLIMTSLKIGDRALNSPNLFQGPFGIDNYVAVFSQTFHLNLRNSLVVAGSTTILCVIVGSLAAYAIARLPLRNKFAWLTGVLAVSLFPPVALVPPLYELWRSVGLLNTWEGLVIPYTAFTLPLTIFILVTFFAAIPKELEEAAKVDGATPFQAFYKIILPLAAPGVFAAAIIIFVSAWNEFLLASTFAPRNAEVAQTVPVAIATFTGAVEFQRPIGTITAACVVVTIPMIIMALAFQRRIVAGLTTGAVKG
ncbi:carbohydrate ABC transporter permease [Bogoriella caseilytica]|uniref:Carbohydrate ABC transporter membrane protein 2 (CUT1 family) n=1 Tax=Bogoriella caseilytica TaxID=56055 RepID=A0A3N2BGC5_9MICO|nr:carbohydrate ABC transporter permease [Bogoriella caseilytica]ROR74311.1 carbohydrate ABC transporter membrane protein 2 (CUT1 family) [Bogoriella caseilytica]